MTNQVKLSKGQVFQNEDCNIFILSVVGEKVRYIEGYSPSAIHSTVEIPINNLISYMNEYGYKLNEDFWGD